MGNYRLKHHPAFIFVALLLMVPELCISQVRKNADGHRGSLYFSAGYGLPFFMGSKISIDQPKLKNNYQTSTVTADNNSYTVFSPLFLSYRVGFFFNYDQDKGVELNYDPFNYHVTDGQNVQFKGTLTNVPGQTDHLTFSHSSGYYYYLSGANLILANFVRRYRVVSRKNGKLCIDLVGRVGAGVAMPSISSDFSGHMLNAQLQFGGPAAGVEVGARCVIKRHLFLEAAPKFAYAMMQNLNVYDGTAKQNFGAYGVAISAGYWFRTSKHNALLFGLTHDGH